MRPRKAGPRWLQRIVKSFDAAFAKLPEPYWLKGDWPLWVQNVGLQLSKAFYPTAKLKVSKCWEPGEVGAMVGQQIAYFAALGDAIEIPKEKPDWEKLRLVYGNDIKSRVRDYNKKFGKEFLPAIQSAVESALVLAIQQEYHGASRFFAAFGRAIQRKPANLNDAGGVNVRIYIFLMVAWRSVAKLESIAALHGVLCKIFGSHWVGKLKRVEKMCQRIELRFRGRGAPRRQGAVA